MTYLAPVPRVRPSGWLVRLSGVANANRAPVPVETRQARQLSAVEMAEIAHMHREVDAEIERAAAGQRICETLAARASSHSHADRALDVLHRGLDWGLVFCGFLVAAGALAMVLSAASALSEVF